MKVFVGYANEDKAAAREIVEFLEALGLDVWFDKKSLVPGDDWDAERLAAQKAADLIIHICSEQILARPGVVNREIRETLRLAEDRPFGGNFVIFVRIGGVRLPASFLRYHYIDFEGDWKPGLLAGIGKNAESATSAASATSPSYKRDNLSTSARFSTRSIEEKEAVFELSVEYIEYNHTGIYWRMVNSHVEARVLELYHDFKADIDHYAQDQHEAWFRPAEYQVRVEEFYQHDDFVSLRYYVYVDMGGAHGNYRTVTSNFFGSNTGKVSIRDLLANDDDKAKKLLSYCLKVVEAGFDNDDPQQWMIDQNDTAAVWNVLDNFSFDQKGITFNFSPYDILYYAAGSHEANMPWQVASNYVAERYMEPWQNNMLK